MLSFWQPAHPQERPDLVDITLRPAQVGCAIPTAPESCVPLQLKLHHAAVLYEVLEGNEIGLLMGALASILDSLKSTH